VGIPTLELQLKKARDGVARGSSPQVPLSIYSDPTSARV